MYFEIPKILIKLFDTISNKRKYNQTPNMIDKTNSPKKDIHEYLKR